MGVQVAFSLNMLPIKTMKNIINYLSVYAKLFSQMRLYASVRSLQPLFDNKSRFFRQFRLCLLAAHNMRRITKTTFNNTILHIVNIGAQEQMVRVNTVSNITSMTNQLTLWDISKVQFIRHTVNFCASIFTHFWYCHLSIAFSIKRASPKPTSIGFINFIPKSVFNRNSASHISTITKSIAFVKELA